MSELRNDGPVHGMWADSSPLSAAPDALQEEGYNVAQEAFVMPMIDVYAAEGTFADKHTLASNLADAVMRWEQVPDLPLFRNNTAGFVHDLPDTSLANVNGESNYVRVQVLTPTGALDRDKQIGVVKELTEIVARAAGDPSLAQRTWVLLTESPEGGWGIAGHANTGARHRSIRAGRTRRKSRVVIPGTSQAETTYTVKRLTVAVPGVREFQERYEQAVPALPLEQVTALVERAAPWSEMLDLIADSAPYGFLIYFRNDVHPVMQLAGDGADCIAYLMGNHTIAEQMFRYDPRAMLYAPLHTVIWEDSASQAWFTADQPSTQFDSFGIPEVATVGVELDRKLAVLLEALGVDVPPSLHESQARRGQG